MHGRGDFFLTLLLLLDWPEKDIQAVCVVNVNGWRRRQDESSTNLLHKKSYISSCVGALAMLTLPSNS